MHKAIFTEGSTFKHLVKMSTTSAIGITSLFFVDLLNMFFLSLLGHQELAAAVGFAGSILFFTVSLCIGLSISCGALVGKSIGANEHDDAKSYVVNNMVFAFIVSIVVSFILFCVITPLLALLGAKSDTLTYATQYLTILIPSMPILAIGMISIASLRAVGDAKLAMYCTLLGGLVNAIFDPIFIFGLSLNVQGAAMASVIARLSICILGFYGIQSKHQLLTQFDYQKFKEHLSDIIKIALPAMITNTATPIGNAYITYAIAQYGDSYVAGYSVVGRLMPVAFGMIFSLSGAIGPIIAQNYGAHLYHRVSACLQEATLFSTIYVIIIGVVLFFSEPFIVHAFSLQGDAAHIIHIFCHWFSFSFVFNGMLFIANASFNNLGHPRYATFFNLAKATLGTMPFVYIGALYADVNGIMIGIFLGSVLFGLASMTMAFKVVRSKQGLTICKKDELTCITQSPLSSSCSQLGLQTTED